MTIRSRPTKPKKLRSLAYSPHLITYVDILGFRELVKEQTPNFISKAIRRLIEATAPRADIKKANQENYVNFSDLIVHTVPIDSPSNLKNPQGLVFYEIHSLAIAQAELIGDGLLLRGALTIGEMERTYGVLFGPGLISAYDLEREQAQFPRIVVDSDLIDALKEFPLLRRHEYDEEMDYISKYIKRDDDGVIFIDYLGGMQDEFSDGADYFTLLTAHKNLIEKGIAKFKDNQRVLFKYLWLKKYHNAVVQTRLTSDFHEEYYITLPDTAHEVPPLVSGLRVNGDKEDS